MVYNGIQSHVIYLYENKKVSNAGKLNFKTSEDHFCVTKNDNSFFQVFDYEINLSRKLTSDNYL